MGYIKSGSRIVQSESIEFMETLRPGNYLVQYDEFGQKFFLIEHEDFKLPKKVYGNIQPQIDRYLKTYTTRDTNLGVLLSGYKGTGKSLLAKNLCIQSKLPVIIVSDGFASTSFKDFISNIDQECVIFFDEFEKVYGEGKDQADMLTLLDGTFNGKKLFLFTINDVEAMNDHMINRPGRIWYNKHYGNLDPLVINEVIEDLLVNKEFKTELLETIDIIGIKSLDILISLIDEINLHGEPPKISAGEMCLFPDFSIRYDRYLSYKGTDLEINDVYLNHPGSDEYIEFKISMTGEEKELFPDLWEKSYIDEPYESFTVVNKDGKMILTHPDYSGLIITYIPRDVKTRYIF